MNKLVNILFLSALLGAACNSGSSSNSSAADSTATDNAANNTTVTFSQSTKGSPSTIRGTVSGLTAGAKAFLDLKTADAHDTKGSIEIAADGSFELKADVTSPSLFRLRLDGAPIYLILSGNETINLQAKMAGGKLESCTIEGSPLSQELFEQGRKSEKDIIAYLDQSAADKALVNYALVEKLNISTNLDRYKKVHGQLVSAYPSAFYIAPLQVKIAQEEATRNAPRIEIGATAPDITMANVDGDKNYSLSDLRGKIVLIDFWASWCMPCRKENPNVVKLYKQYKSKGFEVFSVSLDGIDDRTMTMLGDHTRVTQEMDRQRQLWKDAIAKDGLEWKYHVSDLRKWNCAAAATYQVSSIPRTFLLDREGKIRYMNLRGAELETRLKELL